MTLLNKNREALLAMATETLPAEEQQRLRDLIATDAECRAYWESLQQVTGELRHNAASTPADLPLGFHDRLLDRIAPRPNTNEDTVKGLSVFEWIARPVTITAAAAVLVTALALAFLPSATPETPVAAGPKPSLPPISPKPDAASWVALRASVAEPASLLASTSQRTAATDYPTMGWADRERWIQELDL